MDKLDGRIDAGFFDRKAAEFRSEQCSLMHDIDEHRRANQTYLDEGIRLLELAQRAHRLFESQPGSEKKQTAEFCTFELPLEERSIGS